MLRAAFSEKAAFLCYAQIPLNKKPPIISGNMDEKRSVALREFAKTALRWIFINPNGDVLMSASKPYLEGNKWKTKTSYDIIKIGENARLIDVNWKDTLSDINSREEDIESSSMRSWIDYAKHTVEFKWLAVGAAGYIWGITDKDKPEPNFRDSWWDATWLPWYSESLSDIPLEMRNEVVLGRTYDRELTDNWDKTLMPVCIHIAPRKDISEWERKNPNDLREFNFEELMNTINISKEKTELLQKTARNALNWVFAYKDGTIAASKYKPMQREDDPDIWYTCDPDGNQSIDIMLVGTAKDSFKGLDLKDTVTAIGSKAKVPAMQEWGDNARNLIKWVAVDKNGILWGFSCPEMPEKDKECWSVPQNDSYAKPSLNFDLEPWDKYRGSRAILGETNDPELIKNWENSCISMNTQTISWNEYLNTIPADNKSENVIINENLSGVEFTPADNLNEYSFEECNLSGTKGLSVKHIEEADGFSKCNMPAEVEGFTVDKAKELGDKFDECTWPALELQPGDNLKGIDLTAANISRFKGLTPEILASANGYAECVTPAMEIKPETDFSKISLQDLDMRHWKGLTVEHLNQTPSFAGAKLPKMNLHGLQTKGRSLYMVDFGEAYGLTWAMCKESKDLAGAKLPIMRIPVEKEKFVEDSPATRQAIKEKRQPAKTVVEDMDMGDTDVMGCDFSKVQGLKELQVEKIRQFGGIGARVELSREQEQSLRSKQQAIGQMAREIAEIVHPMPPDSDKVRYRCPNWLNPIAQSMAWFCKENKIEHSKLANLFAKAEPEVVRSGFAQVKADWLLAKKAGLTVEEFTQKGFAVEKAPEVDR